MLIIFSKHFLNGISPQTTFEQLSCRFLKFFNILLVTVTLCHFLLMTLAVSVSQNKGIDLNHACVSTKISFITVRNSSCGKVMFSQVSVCPQGGGVHPQAHIPLGRHPPGRHPPWADPPVQTLPLGRHASHGRQTHPSGQTSPGQTPHWADARPLTGRHSPGQTPPWADTLPWADTPPPEMATAADGMHPTGMHSC